MDIAPPAPFLVEVDAVAGTMRLVGELDLATGPHIISAAEQLSAYRGDVGVDMSEVTFVDSVGIGALVRLRNLFTTSHSALRLHGASASVCSTLRISGLEELLT